MKPGRSGSVRNVGVHHALAVVEAAEVLFEDAAGPQRVAGKSRYHPSRRSNRSEPRWTAHRHGIVVADLTQKHLGVVEHDLDRRRFERLAVRIARFVLGRDEHHRRILVGKFLGGITLCLSHTRLWCRRRHRDQQDQEAGNNQASAKSSNDGAGRIRLCRCPLASVWQIRPVDRQTHRCPLLTLQAPTCDHACDCATPDDDHLDDVSKSGVTAAPFASELAWRTTASSRSYPH